MEMLIQSVRVYPYNWSAWLELATLVPTHDQLQAVAAQLPHTIMRTFFMAHLSGEFQHLGQDECQSLFDALLGVFPNSRYLTAQQAVLLYNFRRFEMAEQVFDAARRQDPYTVEDMDLYSNVMFVNESSAKLSTLAHVCTRIDKYRPETCVVVGRW